ncbi:MAG TPA: hypothetical protein VNE58_13900 [Casimicrobiaceae bacterium]|nr:hypothetical protein [Casimicrobiaceae bacterium]
MAAHRLQPRALMDLVWPDVVVEENNLAAQISALRKVSAAMSSPPFPGAVIASRPSR